MCKGFRMQNGAEGWRIKSRNRTANVREREEGKRQEVRGKRQLLRFCVSALAVTAATAPVRANVDIESRPAAQTVCLDETVHIALYMISDSDIDQSIGALEVILLWDPTRLELLGKEDNGPYTWLASNFPDDSALDGLNVPFEGPPPFVPDNDGDAYYVAWAQFAPAPPAYATPEGLLVTTFLFRALTPGTVQLDIPTTFGKYTATRVYDGFVPGLEVTGEILDPAQVTIHCPQPMVSAQGSRYLAVTPASCGLAVALRVTGDPDDPEVACVWGYVQPDGTLAETPIFQTPVEWETVHVRGEEIRPGTTYHVQAECDAELGVFPSENAPASTWPWGDANDSGWVNLDDVLLVLDGFRGVFDPATLENVDLYPCLPDGQIDADDILGVLDGFGRLLFSAGCPQPCP